MMAYNNNPFSMSTMLNALQQLRFPTAGEETMIPEKTQPLINPCRCGFCQLNMRLRSTFDLMTNSVEGSVAQFKENVSLSDRFTLQRMASFMTFDSDYFMTIATNQFGSKRMQILIGKSDDVDAFFIAAIMRCFLKVMTDKYASYVAVRLMRVLNEEKKTGLYEHVLYYLLRLASDQHGCIALNEIITDADDPYYREQLLDVVALNALWLSNDSYGNFVVQHVLKLKDLRCTFNIAFGLSGHCVELSFRKHGSYIVERLLEAEEESMVVVVEELLECEGNRLMRLARSEYGNFVVLKALRLTQKIRVDLFKGLVDKLMPYLYLLRRSYGSNIANLLESLV